MDWLDDYESLYRHARGTRRRELGEIRAMHSSWDEMEDMLTATGRVVPQVRAEMERLRIWFLLARRSSRFEDMQWLDCRVRLTMAWAEGQIGEFTTRCKQHEEPLRLLICPSCGQVSGVGCGYGCGATPGCRHCVRPNDSTLWYAEKPGSPAVPPLALYEGPRCEGCGTPGVPFVRTCQGVLGEHCQKPLCSRCDHGAEDSSYCRPCEHRHRAMS